MATENGTWPGLLAAAKRAEINGQSLKFLRCSLVAPVELHDFPEVLRKLRGVLESAESTWPGILVQLDISSFPIILWKLETESKKFIWLHISEQYRYTERGGPTTGLRDRNAIYAALLALPEKDSEYTNSCRLLMAQAFFAQLRILRIPNGTRLEGGLIKGDTSVEAYESYAGREPWPAMTISPRHIGLALRGLFSGEDWALDMIQQFQLTQPPDTFAKCEGFEIQPDQLRNGQTKEKLAETRDCVLRYVAQAYGIKARHRGHGKTAKKVTKPLTPTSECNYPTTGANSLSSTPATGGVREAQSKDEAVAAPQANGGDDDRIRFDACPGEDDESNGDLEDEDEFSAESSQNQAEDHKHKGHPKRISASRRRGSSGGAGTDQAIRASKFMPCDKDRLTPFELVSLDVDARRRFASIVYHMMENRGPGCGESEAVRFEQHQALIVEAEVILFALVMLWTASSTERTKDLLLSGSSEYEGDNPLVIEKGLDQESDVFIRIHTEWPPDASRREPIPLDRVRAPDVRLEDSAGVGRMLREFYVAVSGIEPGVGTEQVFKRPIEFYADGVTDLLMSLDPTGRLTPGKLESYMYDELMSWTTKDASATTIITGNYRTAARVQMFYADRLEKHMQEINTGTTVFARNSINLAAMPRGSAAQAIAHLDCLVDLVRKPEFRVPFLPAPVDAVYVGINVCPTEIAMRNAVQQLRESLLESAIRPGKWNQTFNLYTFWSVWYFGFVTGSRPIECPYLWLNEVNRINHTARYQDKGDGKARLVWIPEGLLSQMEHYESFLRRTRLGRLTEYPCWLVDEEGRPQVVKPSTLERHLHRFLPGYPSNIARRWMMNALLESGCRVVPEWCGHARTGNQLTGRSGTASPHQVGLELRRHLDPIIDFLGLQPIEGKIT
jgi:hypothetical protein